MRPIRKSSVLILALASLSLFAQAPQSPPPAPPARVRTDTGSFGIDSHSRFPDQTGAISREAMPRLDGFDLEPLSGKAPNQIGGASRGLEAVRLYAPVLGKAYTLNPTFNWGFASPGATTEFTFRLVDSASPNSATFETTVSGGAFTYPATAPALRPGTRYLWTVTPSDELLGASSSASILIVGGAERSAIDDALHAAPSSPTNQAELYVRKRLWFDAVAAYTSLIASDPQQSFYRRRAEIYAQLPRTAPLADADLLHVDPRTPAQ